MPPPPPDDWSSDDLMVPITLGAAVLVVVLWNLRLRIAKAVLRQEADDGPATAEPLPPAPEAPVSFGLRSKRTAAPCPAARVGPGGATSRGPDQPISFGRPAQPISFGRRAPSSYAQVQTLGLDMDDDT